MSAHDLFQAISEAVSIVGMPEWVSPERGGVRETLYFLEGDESEGGPCWAMADAEGHGDELLLVAADAARAMFCDHFRAWLVNRGWQVQAAVDRKGVRWRLVDCLAAACGGGDRLDEVYPKGDDELMVMCESIAVVARCGRGWR